MQRTGLTKYARKKNAELQIYELKQHRRSSIQQDYKVIKNEPRTERPEWALIAVSEAARKWRNKFVLELNQDYTVGRSSFNDIHLPSPFCSKVHCSLKVVKITVNDQTHSEIILKDNSSHGTRVNAINYKDSRCIISEGDLLGFGCKTKNRHIKDKSDNKYYVYRVANANELISCGTIELSDESDDEALETNENIPSNNSSYGNDTDDECPSADEMDVKPDIHTLMRMVKEQQQIKVEIAWNCHEYEKSHNIQTDAGETMEGVVEEPICLSSDEECYADEQPSTKRVRREDNMFPTPEPQSEDKTEPNDNDKSQADDFNFNKPIDQTPVVPEYQMSDATLKEKVKNVTRSRGQQLAIDMLIDQARPSMERQNSHGQGPSTSIISPPATPHKTELGLGTRPVEDLTNDFISEVTKWEFKWLDDNKVNPLRFKMDVRPLDTNFSDLTTFQGQMKNFLLMEVYSILFTEYCNRPQTTNKQSLTQLQSCAFNPILKRFVLGCYTAKEDCPNELKIRKNDLAVVKHSKGRFIAYVTQSKSASGGWEFELQAAQTENNKTALTAHHLQIAFITNIQTMLECFISLYELRNSSLQEVFLRPSSQFEDYDADDDFVKMDRLSILNKIYEKCAVSVFGGSKILLVNGGAGTGKTTFIRDLLERFSSEDFQVTNSILVCGMNDALVDSMAIETFGKIRNIARFGKISAMNESVRVRSIGVEMFSPKQQDVKVVFTTLNNAVDLLHADRTFDLCIVDDASLCSEAELLPLFRLKINTLLLVGDEKLQTSTTQNECCRENGYSRSLFTRVIESYKQFDPKRKLYPTLNQQRRMHQEICSWPNKYFYKQQMNMIAKQQRRTTFAPYSVFQVNNIEDIEVDFLKQLLEFCVKGIDPKKCSYGIICGHPSSKGQIEAMLKENPRFANIKVSGYDSFQGQEKDIIIMTALKPDDGFTLFGTNENLLIALTRAKESLILCGNFQYVSANVEWSNLLSDAKIKKRFYDLNGIFDATQINKIMNEKRL